MKGFDSNVYLLFAWFLFLFLFSFTIDTIDIPQMDRIESHRICFRWNTNDCTGIWYISIWSTGSVYIEPGSISSACTISTANSILELSIATSFANHIFCPSAGRSSARSDGLESGHDRIMECIVLDFIEMGTCTINEIACTFRQPHNLWYEHIDGAEMKKKKNGIITLLRIVRIVQYGLV